MSITDDPTSGSETASETADVEVIGDPVEEILDLANSAPASSAGASSTVVAGLISPALPETDDADDADDSDDDVVDIWLRDTPEELIPKMREQPVSRAAYYEQLIITEAAGSGGASGPLDGRVDPFVDEDVTAMHQPSVGVLLTFEQGWYQRGLALGELRKSLTLAPGEVTKVAVVDWRRQTTSRDDSTASQSEQLAAQTDDASTELAVQQAVQNDSRQSSAFNMGRGSHSQSSGGGSFLGLISGSSSSGKSAFMGVSATASAGQRDVATQASKNIERRTQQVAQSARSARATQIREVTETETQTTSTRVIANYNHAHALTMQYYEVLQIYQLQTKVVRADRCIFVPIKPLAFTEESMIATNESTLELLRQVLQEFGATELDEKVAEFQKKLPDFKDLHRLAVQAKRLRAIVERGTNRKIEAPRVRAVEVEKANGDRSVIRDSRPVFESTVPTAIGRNLAANLVGRFENFPLDPATQNDWHIVDIAAIDAQTLRWTNRAGVSWTLRITDNEHELEVGSDCPYYSNGYTTAAIAFDALGRIKHIIGPGNAPYLHEVPRIERLVGRYENFPDDPNLRNNWHGVNVTPLGGNQLRWTNDAGVNWTLSLTGDDNVLAVGPDCPYYAGGYTSAKVGFDATGNVTHLAGPGNAPYINEATSQLVRHSWQEQSVSVVESRFLTRTQANEEGHDPDTPLLELEGSWRRTETSARSYDSQAERFGRVWDQWSWYLDTGTEVAQVDMWRRRVTYGSGDQATEAAIVAQFDDRDEHEEWVTASLQLAHIERRYAADRGALDEFSRMFGLLDDVGLALNQQMWMRTDDHAWRTLLADRVFPDGEYKGQDIGGLINPTPLGFFGNYLAFHWDFPQDRLGETMYREQATAFEDLYVDSDRVGAAKTKTEATLALPTEGIFAEAVLGQANSAEKIDMTRFWNWQDSPIPILPPEMAAVSSDSRARNIAGPDRLRLAESLVALRQAGVNTDLIDDSILGVLGISLDNGDSAALLANAAMAATTASDNAFDGAGSAGKASVDTQAAIGKFAVDLANSEAAKLATEAIMASATGGASKVGGLLGKAGKLAGKTGKSRGKTSKSGGKSGGSRTSTTRTKAPTTPSTTGRTQNEQTPSDTGPPSKPLPPTPTSKPSSRSNESTEDSSRDSEVTKPTKRGRGGKVKDTVKKLDGQTTQPTPADVRSWRPDNFPGILIEGDDAFQAGCRRDLETLLSKPIGRALLTLLSKRHQGIGVPRAGHKRRDVDLVKGAVSVVIIEAADADDTMSDPDADDDYRSRPPSGIVERPGIGQSSIVTYGPTLGPVYSAQDGHESPAFTALGHELIHSLHSMSGDSVKPYSWDTDGALLEEARTVGLSIYRNTRISENAIRREHGLPERTYYGEPGDTDALIGLARYDVVDNHGYVRLRRGEHWIPLPVSMQAVGTDVLITAQGRDVTVAEQNHPDNVLRQFTLIGDADDEELVMLLCDFGASGTPPLIYDTGTQQWTNADDQAVNAVLALPPPHTRTFVPLVANGDSEVAIPYGPYNVPVHVHLAAGERANVFGVGATVAVIDEDGENQLAMVRVFQDFVDDEGALLVWNHKQGYWVRDLTPGQAVIVAVDEFWDLLYIYAEATMTRVARLDFDELQPGPFG